MFEPDPAYLDYFLKTRSLIQKRLERLHKGGAEDAIIFEEYQLEIIEKYIRKIDPNALGGRQTGFGGENNSQKEDRIVSAV